MSTIRQDAWSDDEDLLLAETVLRHIREGSTQLVAFEEVGRTLSRTSAACGFRWNSLVRKKYESAIILAKKQRKELQNQKKAANRKNRAVVKQKKEEESKTLEEPAAKVTEDMDLEQVIGYLESLKNEETALNALRSENHQLKKALELEKKRSHDLKATHQEAMRDYEAVKSDYQAMLSFMDKARKLAEPERVPEKVNE